MKKFILLVTLIFASLCTLFLAGCKNNTSTTTESVSTTNSSETTKSTSSSTSSDSNKVSLTVVNGKGTGSYNLNQSVTVTATLSETTAFDHWEVDGETVSSENPYTFTITESMTITAVLNTVNRIANYSSSVVMKNDSFKILNLADVQLTDGDDLTLTYHIIDTLVEREKPDMIVILGDTINDHKTYGVKNAASDFIFYIDSLDIPWAPIFGNHDNSDYQSTFTSKKQVGTAYLIELFNECDNCLFINGPKDVQGSSNYMINVVTEEGSFVESLIFLDSRINGLDSSNVSFYEECVEYAKELNNNETVKSVVFTHIPIQEYEDVLELSAKNDYIDLVGMHAGNGPLVCGDHSLFNKMLELDSTKTVICGHDHEDAYYNVYKGITLAHGMKSSDGDDQDDISFRHALGGLMLIVDGEHDDILKFSKVEDIGYTILSGSDYPFFPEFLPFWQQSGAKLVFEIEMPSTGTVKMNLQGTNLLRESVTYDKRIGAWNRLTTNVTFNGSTKSVDFGTLTLISGNKYKYEVDLMDLSLNKSGGEEACGDETCRLVYFHNCSGTFTITNIHFEKEEITETNQIDLDTAVIEKIDNQFYTGMPVKPEPVVKVGGITLNKVTDIIYTYKNNIEEGTATLTIIPSGKGAHNYKGFKTVTFSIVSNPDDDTLPGHENAITVNTNDSYVTNDKENKWIKVSDWYNCGKKLHIEVKRLENGKQQTGETVRFCLMGTNANPGSHEGPNSNWNRLTGYYNLDFSNGTVVCYKSGSPSNIIATGYSIGDGWFAIDIDFKDLELNSTENALGNDKETMQRVEFSYLKRSFKYDNVSLVN